MNLIIVESPTKAKTISRFLGKDFIVASSFGHVRDLPKGELGVDIEHDFEPKYVVPTKAKKNVAILKKDAEKSDTIILATDEDREGEAIAWHLSEALGLNTIDKKQLTSGQSKVKGQRSKVVQRIVFHEITKSAIEQALKNPRQIDENLVDAQQARRILDRLVGYKLSPFLWKKVARGLSAGRVQSVAVRLIVEREREIEKFKPDEYWNISVELKTGQDKVITAELVKIDGETLDKLAIKNQAQAQKIVSDLAGADYKVSAIDQKEMVRNPFAPFTTSTLQQDAARKLHFSAKQTMRLAQQLYEGVELGPDGSHGLITYMRTDSVNLSAESLTKAREYITSSYGEKYLEIRQYKTKSKGAQEAHEAIRPTDPTRHPDAIQQYLSPQQFRLYNLIWRRFTASQMAKAIFNQTGIDIQTKQYGFRANGTTMKFDGFLKVYPTKFEENELPVVKTGEELELKELKPEQHFTKPPARYNEASLIKTLEKEGIGRPSTYATIISTIQDRNYVTKDRSRYFSPTEIGVMVNDLLVEHFPKIVDIKFTSQMEEELDDIAEGKREWVPVLRKFYTPFAKQLEEKYKEVTKEKVTNQIKTGEKCPECKEGDLVEKMGRYGRFTACSRFPDCKYIQKKPKAEVETTGEKCDKCGEGEMIIRSGKFGKFLACSRYPKCKNTRKIETQ